MVLGTKITYDDVSLSAYVTVYRASTCRSLQEAHQWKPCELSISGPDSLVHSSSCTCSTAFSARCAIASTTEVFTIPWMPRGVYPLVRPWTRHVLPRLSPSRTSQISLPTYSVQAARRCESFASGPEWSNSWSRLHSGSGAMLTYMPHRLSPR